MTDPVPASRRPRANPALPPAAGRLALACGLLAAVACGPAEPPGQGRTVVLISLDTLRPDRMGAYGGVAEVSPHVDALAADGVVFEQALAPAPWTLPSHMTMLTGLDPVAHGVHNGGVRLSRHVHTLAEHLSDAGFTTAAFTDGGFVSGFYGFEQGFDTFDDERADDGGPDGMRRVAPPAVAWLDDLDADDDAFLFVHTFDAHSYYDSAAPEVLERFRARGAPDGPDDHAFAWLRHLQQQVKVGLDGYHRMAQLMNDYDAGIHQADLGVGAIVAALREAGRYDDALVIVTSDHGEAFFEHDLHVGHGIGHRDNELRVPLVAKLPGGEGASTRHDELVGLVDIARTVLDALELQPRPELQGESLLGLVRGEPRRNDWLLGFCNNSANGWLVKGGFKYVTPTAIAPMTVARKHLGPNNPPGHVAKDGGGEEYEFGDVTLRYDEVADPLGLKDVLPATEELYDRGADPGEQHDLAAERPDLTSQMRGFYQAQNSVSKALYDELRDLEAEAEVGTNAAANLDRMQARLLAQLGYVEGDVSVEQVSPKMRKWANNPHVAPDTSALVETDRRVHVLRATLLDGRPAPDDAAEVLQAAGKAYYDWGMANPTHRARVLWRLTELETLAALSGVTLDPRAWR